MSQLDEITADMFCSSRGNEIKAYFEETGMDMDAQRYVILDDLKDVLSEQEDHFIRIDPDRGDYGEGCGEGDRNYLLNNHKNQYYE